jgi:hypothetical protein
MLRAGTGSYGWDVAQSVLANNATVMNAQLYIVVTSTDTDTENRTKGPLVQVVAVGASVPSVGDVNVVAIVVPTVLGVLSLMFLVWYLWMRRRNPGWTFRSVLGMSRNEGYGTRKSKAQRTGPAGGVGSQGVRMGDMDMRPGVGRNVFREEIRRQGGSRV